MARLQRTLSRSEDLFHQACRLMPGGVSSPVRAFGAVGGTPIFLAGGSGSRVTDADGREYIDMLGSWGPLILGHADPGVVEAIKLAAGRGTSFGAPIEAEAELADLISRALPAMQMVRFVSSGTEATMSALRLARAATGRSKVVKFEGCYHGHSDSFLASAGSGPATLGLSDSPGVPEAVAADTVVCRYNSEKSVEEAFDAFGASLAAVIVEPIAANMGVVAPSAGFLEALRKLCDSNGTLLIFDEVVTGFRVGYRGAQGLLNVVPDLTTLGKVIGGGLPVGAYGGRQELMEMVAPSGPVYQAGTLSGNPITMAAGIATLRRLEPGAPGESINSSHKSEGDLYARLETMAGVLAEGLDEQAKQANVSMHVQRAGSMLTPFFIEDEVFDFADAKRCDLPRFARFFHAMLDEGIYWPPSQFEAAFISAAHTREDVQRVISAAGNALSQAAP